MDARSKLMQLYTHLDCSFEEYIGTPEAEWLLGLGDLLQRIAQYNLPEVTMLICASLDDQSPEWMRRYTPVYSLYANPSLEEFERVLQALGLENFCTEILPLLDRNRLQRILGFRKILEKRNATNQDEKEKIQLELNKRQAEREEILRQIEILMRDENVDAKDKTKQKNNLGRQRRTREKKIEECSAQIALRETQLINCKMAISAVQEAEEVFSQFGAEYESKLKTVCAELESIAQCSADEGKELQYEDVDLHILAQQFLCTDGKKRVEIMEQLEAELFDPKAQNGAVSEFYGALLDQTTGESNVAEEYALQLITRLEEELSDMKKRAEKAERKLLQISESIYGACYQPIESLELLASNLRCFDKAISPRMLCTKLTSPLVKLREGLSKMGVFTAASLDEWESGQLVSYDQMYHEAETPLSDPNVILRTMGFIYQNKWEEECIHPAKVLNKAVIPNGKEVKPRLEKKNGKRLHSKVRKLKKKGSTKTWR